MSANLALFPVFEHHERPGPWQLYHNIRVAVSAAAEEHGGLG